MASPDNPFRYFNSSPEVIRLVSMMYVRYPLSLRNLEEGIARQIPRGSLRRLLTVFVLPLSFARPQAERLFLPRNPVAEPRKTDSHHCSDTTRIADHVSRKR